MAEIETTDLAEKKIMGLVVGLLLLLGLIALALLALEKWEYKVQQSTKHFSQETRVASQLEMDRFESGEALQRLHAEQQKNLSGIEAVMRTLATKSIPEIDSQVVEERK